MKIRQQTSKVEPALELYERQDIEVFPSREIPKT